MTAVLICIAGIVVELALFIAVMNSNSTLATASARAGIATSLICALSGAAGLRHQQKIALPELGVALGLIGLVFFVLLEATSTACWVCF